MEEKFYKPGILCSGRIFFKTEGQTKIFFFKTHKNGKNLSPTCTQEMSKEGLSALGNDNRWKCELA